MFQFIREELDPELDLYLPLDTLENLQKYSKWAYDAMVNHYPNINPNFMYDRIAEAVIKLNWNNCDCKWGNTAMDGVTYCEHFCQRPWRFFGMQ